MAKTCTECVVLHAGEPPEFEHRDLVAITQPVALCPSIGAGYLRACGAQPQQQYLHAASEPVFGSVLIFVSFLGGLNPDPCFHLNGDSGFGVRMKPILHQSKARSFLLPEGRLEITICKLCHASCWRLRLVQSSESSLDVLETLGAWMQASPSVFSLWLF